MSFYQSIKKLLFDKLRRPFEPSDYQRHTGAIAAMVRVTGDAPSPHSYDSVEEAFDVYRQKNPHLFN